MLTTPWGHGIPCPDIYSCPPRGKKALIRTCQAESVSWTRTLTRPIRSFKPQTGLIRWGRQTAASTAALPLTSRLGIEGTPHSWRESRPGETVQFLAAPMAPPGLTSKHPHPAGAAPRDLRASPYLETHSHSGEGSLLLREGGHTSTVIEGKGRSRNPGHLAGCHLAPRYQLSRHGPGRGGGAVIWGRSLPVFGPRPG